MSSKDFRKNPLEPRTAYSVARGAEGSCTSHAGELILGLPEKEEISMTTTKVVLRFPPELTDQPVTYKLIKEYDLMVNILRGHIIPKEEGM